MGSEGKAAALILLYCSPRRHRGLSRPAENLLRLDRQRQAFGLKCRRKPHPRLSWIERQTANPGAGNSNLFGCAIGGVAIPIQEARDTSIVIEANGQNYRRRAMLFST
jgi:hypothetical protein